MRNIMTLTEYLIGTCLGCKKCLYCGVALSIRKRTCLCDKTIKPSKNNRTDKVKIAYPRISTPDLPLKQFEYIQEKVTHFKYSLDLNKKFNFAFCPACNSVFQRKKKSSAKCKVDSNKNDSETNTSKNDS